MTIYSSKRSHLTRRRFIQMTAGSLTAIAAAPAARATPGNGALLKYAHGRPVPPVGMGTWLTFDVTPEGPPLESRKAVLDEFFAHGGGMIDSSPMYGNAEEVVGKLLTGYEDPYRKIFSATKIWTVAATRGPDQLARSHALWKQTPLDLVHVHNLLRWKAHLKTLRAAKDEGAVRYIGLTTSHGRRHEEMERLITTEPVDCVQFTYNILDREAERRLLPAAAEKGLHVVINRPFQGGELFRKLAGKPLPPWAPELGCDSWAAFLLKFILSHPAVGTAIPATSRVDHMRQNMLAGTGPMPTRDQRRRMVRYVETL